MLWSLNLQSFFFSFFLRPIQRTLREHNTVWKMLKTVPDLTSQLTDEHLKILSKNVTSETWVKGSTGNRPILGVTWQDKINITILSSLL